MDRVDNYLIKAFEAKQQDLRDLAMEYFTKAAAEEPEDIEILIELAKSQIDCGLKADARATLGTASKLDCGDIELSMELGRALRLAGATEQALDVFRQAALQPKHSAQATLDAVLLLERQHRLDESAKLLSRCRASKNAPQIKLAVGCLAERRGDLDKALRLYRRVWGLGKGDLSVEAGYRLARLLDRSGKPDEAMGILETCKNAEKPGISVGYLAEFVKRRRAQDVGIAAALPEDWFEPREASADKLGGLLVLGHPRSGTTLLAKLLSSKYRMSWVDESPTFDVMGQRFLARKNAEAGVGGFIRVLENATRREIGEFEEEYHARMTKEAGGEVRILLDKNPGLSASLPALSRLLPHSRWAFLMRDPRDVALSCYFQRLGNTPLGFCSLTLDGALEAVLHVHSYWKALRSRVPESHVAELKYEDLVLRPDPIVSEVAERLGCPVSEVVDADEKHDAPLLESPTYAEIQQPVHTRTTMRWTKHRAVFDGKRNAILDEILETWGYDGA